MHLDLLTTLYFVTSVPEYSFDLCDIRNVFMFSTYLLHLEKEYKSASSGN